MKRLPIVVFTLAIFALGAADFAMADINCSQMNSARSKNSNRPAKLTFVNKTPEMRVITWINFNGGQQQFKMLDAGKKWTISTFQTHPWLVTDGPGNCYGIYVAASSSRTINLVDFGSAGGD